MPQSSWLFSYMQLNCLIFLMLPAPYLNDLDFLSLWIFDGQMVHRKLELSDRLLQKLLEAIIFQQGCVCMICVDTVWGRGTHLIILLILEHVAIWPESSFPRDKEEKGDYNCRQITGCVLIHMRDLGGE